MFSLSVCQSHKIVGVLWISFTPECVALVSVWYLSIYFKMKRKNNNFQTVIHIQWLHLYIKIKVQGKTRYIIFSDFKAVIMQQEESYYTTSPSPNIASNRFTASRKLCWLYFPLSPTVHTAVLRWRAFFVLCTRGIAVFHWNHSPLTDTVQVQEEWRQKGICWSFSVKYSFSLGKCFVGLVLPMSEAYSTSFSFRYSNSEVIIKHRMSS